MFKKNDFQNAARIYAQIIDLSPSSPLALHASFGRAACLEQEGKYADAALIYERMISDHSDRPQIKMHALYRKAQALYFKKEYDEAELVLFDLEALAGDAGEQAGRPGISAKAEELKNLIRIKKN